MEWSPCTGYVAHPFRKIGSEETLMAVTCWFLRISWSYEETHERVADSLVLRWFCVLSGSRELPSVVRYG